MLWAVGFALLLSRALAKWAASALTLWGSIPVSAFLREGSWVVRVRVRVGFPAPFSWPWLKEGGVLSHTVPPKHSERRSLFRDAWNGTFFFYIRDFLSPELALTQKYLGSIYILRKLKIIFSE